MMSGVVCANHLDECLKRFSVKVLSWHRAVPAAKQQFLGRIARHLDGKKEGTMGMENFKIVVSCKGFDGLVT